MRISRLQIFKVCNMLMRSADPLLMNAFNTVNLAAAVIITSTEYARRLGVPEEKWVYPLGGAGKKEKEHCEYRCAEKVLVGHGN